MSLWALFPSDVDFCTHLLWRFLDDQSMMRCLTLNRCTNYVWNHDDVKRRPTFQHLHRPCGWCTSHDVACFHDHRERYVVLRLGNTPPPLLNRYQFQGRVFDHFDHVEFVLGRIGDKLNETTHDDAQCPECEEEFDYEGECSLDVMEINTMTTEILTQVRIMADEIRLLQERLRGQRRQPKRKCRRLA